MPAFNQKQLNNRARNANSVTIMLGDQVIGFGQTASHTIDWGTEGLYGVGSAMPQEIQQLRVSPQVTLDVFALTQAGLAALGQPVNLSSVLANNQFSFHVTDGVSGVALYTYVGCVASNFSENIPANQPISDSISFLALDVLDPTGQSIANVGSAFQVPSAVSPIVGGLGIAVQG